jgi:hypothetical protein
MTIFTKLLVKTILTALGIFVLGCLCAMVLDSHYRNAILFLLQYFNGEHIHFIGKNFHLFASYTFIFSAGIYSLLMYLLIKFWPNKKYFIQIFWSILISTILTLIEVKLDSEIIVLNCTACDDGILTINYSYINHDKYFIMSLGSSLLYL